jgi:transcriptional regulator with XRE-family HTH domain
MSARRAGAADVIVGRNIRQFRLARRMSQAELAHALGISFQQVQKYEKGANRVGAGRLVRLASALGVPVMTLLKGVPGVAQAVALPPPGGVIATAGQARLVQAFATIGNGAVRRALIALTEDAARRAGSRG